MAKKLLKDQLTLDYFLENIDAVKDEQMLIETFFEENEFTSNKIVQEVNQRESNDAVASARIGEMIRVLSENEILNDEDIHKYIDDLKVMFGKDYRISYYSIYVNVQEAFKTQKGISYLTFNLEYLLSEVKKTVETKDSAYRVFLKLIDGIMLEALRYNSQAANNQGILDAEKKYAAISEKIIEQGVIFEGYNKKMQKIESETMNQILTVLGLFSGIIIAFFGGLQLLGSAFNQIDSISKYRLFFMVALLGFIIFNSISVMMILLGKMINKDIYTPCKTKSGSCTCEKKCSMIGRARKRLPYIFYINSAIILFMLILVGIWVADIKF